MNQKLNLAHMKVAEIYASLSKARRLKVGAIVVKDNRVISIGYNGTPSGWDNNCEDRLYTSPWRSEHDDGLNVTYTLKTKPEVIHAEANAIAKLARSSESGLNASMYITHAPCIECAKLIYSSGISSVYYRDVYRDNSGIEFLGKCNVNIQQLKEEDAKAVHV